jgi:hypothetical protein
MAPAYQAGLGIKDQSYFGPARSALPKGLAAGYKVGNMPTVAEQLHQGREAQHLTVPQLAEITKIRGDHLRALEEGNYDAFSAPVYIRGFVRTYATVLKLPVADVMASLDAELGQTKKFAEPPPLSGHSGGWLDTIMLQLSKVDWRRGLLALGVAAGLAGIVLVFVLWRHYKTSDPLAGLKPGLYQPATNPPGETLALPAPAPRRP